MKPGDHPDFFRLPPPPGRSRESSIVLSADGRFLHAGAPVEHPGMRRAFATWLRRHPDDGRPILSNGYDWTYITVEGALRFVRAVESSGGGPELVLLDDARLPLAGAELSCDAAGVLWLRLGDGEQARFTSGAQLQLEPWLRERAGEVGVELDGQFTPIAGASVPPTAGPPAQPGS